MVINVRMQEVYVLYQCGSFPPTVEEVGNILATEMELPAALVAAPTVKFFSIPLQVPLPTLTAADAPVITLIKYTYIYLIRVITGMYIYGLQCHLQFELAYHLQEHSL